MKNNLKKNYFILISIMVLWVIISFFVVQPQYLKKIYTSISDLVIKDHIIILKRNSTKNSVIEKTGVTTLKIYSNGQEIGNTTIIKTGDILKDNGDEYPIAIRGDANKDGVVNSSDLPKIYGFFRHFETPTEVQKKASDVNDDDLVNSSDLIKTYKIYRNLIPDDDDPTPPTVQYTITFNSQGGSYVPSKTVNSGESIGTLPTPIRSGYTFTGWYTDPNGGSQVYSTTKVTGNATYHARWTSNQFDIKFINGEVVVATYQRTSGQQIGSFPVVTKTNYTFAGWWTEQTGGTQVYTTTAVTGPATYYAHWDAVQYKVKFNPNGGSVSETERMVNSGGQIGTLPTPTRDHYTFVEWNTKQEGTGNKVNPTDTVTGPVTYYAKWAIQSFTVSFNSHGGTACNSITRNYGATIGTLPAPTKTGYTLTGWYTAESGGSKISASTTVTKTVEYHAQWKANNYTISFNSQGGSSVASRSIQYGSALGTLPTPTKTNYQFVGWFTAASGGTQISASTKVTGNATYYAHWKFNVLFIGNSKTYYNHMPKLFEKMAETAGRDVDVDMVTVGSRALKCHGNNCTKAKNADYIGDSEKGTKDYIVQKLNSKIYGAVVIQEQTAASIQKTEALKGVNSIKALVNESPKSSSAVIYNNVIWRKLRTDTKYTDLCAGSTSDINKEQKSAGSIATDYIQGNISPREVVVKTGRLLFRYECAQRKLDVSKGDYHLYRSDRNHPAAGATYLEAGLIYAAIFGKPSSPIIVKSGWDCTGNHYNVNTGNASFPNHNTHSFTENAEKQLWSHIFDNYGTDIKR